MIDVHVGQDHPLDVRGANSERPQLRAGFLVRFDVEAYRKTEIGMPAR